MSTGFLDDPIKSYLENFYSRQGEIEFEYLEDGKFTLLECEKCGLVYQEHILNDELMSRLYDVWIDPEKSFEIKAARSDDLSYYAGYAQQIMVMLDYFGVSPSRLKVLDFGMGWGKWCRMAAAFGCNVYGSELSETRIEYAKSIGVSVVKWENVQNAEFDFINAEQVFEHVPNPLELLRQLADSLKPNGLIQIGLPTGEIINRILAASKWDTEGDVEGEKHGTINPVSPLEHVNCFDHDSLVKMASEANLRLVSIPIKTQHTYSLYWRPVVPLLKNLIRPYVRSRNPKGTSLYFSSV